MREDGAQHDARSVEAAVSGPGALLLRDGQLVPTGGHVALGDRALAFVRRGLNGQLVEEAVEVPPRVLRSMPPVHLHVDADRALW